MAKFRGVLVVMLTMLIVGPVWSLSDAEFPESWEEWPVVKKESLPAKSVPVPKDLPEMQRQLIKTYNSMNDGQGEQYEIRINPEQLDAYKKGSGFEDGPLAVMVFKNSKVMFVTEHFAEEPAYGIFDTSGKDLEFTEKTLSLEYCEACHQWYKEECKGGICSNAK